MRIFRIGGTALLATAIIGGAFAASATVAGQSRFAPAGQGIYAGVSDTGSKQDYFDFAERAGAHIPVLQAFEPWGRWPEEAKQRWKRTETRGMLSVSTSPCYECEEVISPGEIRRGRGDGYLLRLNRKLAEWDRPTYIRLLPEMNGYWNPYAAFDGDGTGRDRDHTTRQFRKAWRRSVLIVEGGKRKLINRKLRRKGMPNIRFRGRGRDPRRLPKPQASFLWVPQTHGSPRIRATAPRSTSPAGATSTGSAPTSTGSSPTSRASTSSTATTTGARS